MRPTHAAVITVAVLLQTLALADDAEPLDVLISNARIVDGGGNPWFRGSIGVRGDRIVEVGVIGSQQSAKRVIDAEDRVVAPGFIDLMGQDTLPYMKDPDTALSRLFQGVTTHVSGEGWSHAPQNEHTQPEPVLIDGEPTRWHSYAEYFCLLERYGVPINVAHNVGVGQVRAVVIGDEDRPPTAPEVEEMKRLVDEAMRDGAFGVSTALIYAPGAFSTTGEIVELAKVSAAYGGFYSTHMRNESGDLLAAIDEAISVGRRTGVPVHIHHLKAAGHRNWPLMGEAIARINTARQDGLDVTADIYPYIRNGIGLASFLPPSVYARGRQQGLDSLRDPATRRALRVQLEDSTVDWENWYQHVGADWSKVLITDSGDYPVDVSGLNVAHVAAREGRDVWDVFFDLAAARVGTAPESMNEAQKRAALSAPWVMIETDTPPVNPHTATSTHPRAFGSFTRVLGKYSRDEGVLTLEEAVRRMTSLPANRLGLHDRGRIAPGMAADLVIFDPQRISDLATFEKPLQLSEGVDYLLVNGKLGIDDGRATGVLAGKVLRHEP